MKIIIPDTLKTLIEHLTTHGAKTIIVGGFVRDALLSISSKDIDAEVFGIAAYEKLAELLSPFGATQDVGKHFQVLKLKLDKWEIDFSLPRSEQKQGPGHRGFHTEAIPFASFKDAASRRDFTINAIGFDPLTDTLLDPFDGIKDLLLKQLRHIGPAFEEDPLRVFRAMQFSARFNLTIAPETLGLCKKMPLEELPTERIFEEFKKLLLKSQKPSLGLSVLEDLGALSLFPELSALQGVKQNPKWHPEGDVWVHTLMVVDEMAKRLTGDTDRDLSLMLGAICHDMGKPLCTKLIDGEWRSLGHEEKGVVPATKFLHRLTNDKALIFDVLTLVREHDKPLNLYLNHLHRPVSSGAFHRLALRTKLKDLLLFATADSCGRTTPEALSGLVPHVDWVTEKAKELGILEAPIHPILKGRDLMGIGFKPGPVLGNAIKQAFEAQLDGKFSTLEEGLVWVTKTKKNEL